MNSPIAIFAYRRPEHLAAMLATLEKCKGFSSSPVIVFADGAKGNGDESDVAAVAQLLSNLTWSNLEVVKSDKNRGLKASIFQGVSEVTSKYGRTIVLEDDLHLSPVALTYFNSALTKYQDAERVWSVSGYVYDTHRLSHMKSAFFLPFAQSWGWATWKRAWEKFDIDADIPSEILESPSFQKLFSANGISDFANMLRLAREGKVNSWYIRWYYKIFQEGGLSLFPPRSYVNNRGISGKGGTHASNLNPYDLLVKPRAPWSDLALMPDAIEIDFEAFDAIPKSWEATVIRNIHLAGSIKRRMKSMMPR